MDAEDFEGIKAGLREAVDDIKARQAAYVKQVRAKTHLTQEAFAKRYHLSVRTLQNWEGGKPVDMPAQVLLKLIDRDPIAVDRLLNG
ncbi:helix-turn-helix domain-containing protein [Novosphingobium guangzhouense]|uniref:XRE family transcriptional regulator n=1 Tax=Novosphingobium guangzhouense TaxID=1850347 RepID=A0A2K2G0U1_9SPHN|nr:helix-turn-helix domain-containing protein [Novosphingobium guangzhouense]PNU04598.1 XRE family transcriptional regulator [Novosphingobium guangzhouense]